MDIPAPVIEVVEIDRLMPWAGNPRKDHAVPQIARSIKACGYQAPIIVQKGTYRILAGHGRLKALKFLKVKTVPVIVADVDDDRASIYTIADNKLTELADWDFSAMADLLLDMDAKNIDVSLTGFSEKELKKIMEWTPEPDHKPSSREEVERLRAVLGEVLDDLSEHTESYLKPIRKKIKDALR